MMIGKLIGIGCAACLATGVAQARVGETKEQCETRYGKAVEAEIHLGDGLKAQAKNWQGLEYSTRGLKIEIIFDGDKAVFIKYSNEPLIRIGSSTSSGTPLRSSEVAQLKSANADSSGKWGVYANALLRRVAPQLTVWQSPDSDHFAGYNRDTKTLFICAEPFWELVFDKVRERYESGTGSQRLEGL